MEYAVNTNVQFGLGRTGTILGKDGSKYIVRLDQPFHGQKALLLEAEHLTPIACFWCRDTKLVAVTPFTGEQYDTDTIPTKECPYCKPKNSGADYEPSQTPMSVSSDWKPDGNGFRA